MKKLRSARITSGTMVLTGSADGLGRIKVWDSQEKTNLLIDLSHPDSHGGWAFNTEYDDSDLPMHQPYPPGRADMLTDEQLRTRPFFAPFVGSGTSEGNRFPNYDGHILMAPIGNQDAIAMASRPEARYKLLAEAIPALSFAPAANVVGIFKDPISQASRNFDMQTLRNAQEAWPEERLNNKNLLNRWLHSDIKNIAYPYIYKLFNRIVEEGKLDEE